MQKKMGKAFEFDALLNDSRLVQPNFKSYDLIGAIALSKKLGRPLTADESKQFEK